MRNILLFTILLFFLPINMQAQLGYCTGNSGDPIFTESFGTGTSSNPLPAGTTTYTYTNNAYPLDGFYTLANGTFGNSFDWHEIEDHTRDDVSGKCLIVNAATAPGEFYRTEITGLCENTTYGFSAWLINLVRGGSFCSTQPGGTIPVNVRFEIRNGSDTVELASGNTGNIVESASPVWNEYGLVFNTGNQTSVILRIINNGVGGCGNDLAIDDIEFKTCGDFVPVRDSSDNTSITLCDSETPYSTVLTAIPDGSILDSYAYQWEESSNGIDWTDMPGENNQSISVSLNASGFFRTKIAEVQANLANARCLSFSNAYRVTVDPVSPKPTLACWETAIINPISCSWEVFGTQPDPPDPTTLECWQTAAFNTAICMWEVFGTQPSFPNLEPWETATFESASCSWIISGTPVDTTTEQTVIWCADSDLVLRPVTTIEMPNFQWSNGAITPQITIEETGIYVVDITDNKSQREKIIYTVVEAELPKVESIVSKEDQIIINTVNSGNFLYSLDGIFFQVSPIFFSVGAGKYTIYVKNEDCETVFEFQHINCYIPKFLTPNNDGINDTFKLPALENCTVSEVAIFDRFGKLLVFSEKVPFEWDGTFGNQLLPEGDYWYRIHVDGQKVTGHLTLKR